MVHRYLLRGKLAEGKNPASPFQDFMSFHDHHASVIREAFMRTGSIDSALTIWWYHLCGEEDAVIAVVPEVEPGTTCPKGAGC